VPCSRNTSYSSGVSSFLHSSSVFWIGSICDYDTIISTMTKNVLFAVLIGLSLLGLADSLYLAEKATLDQPLFCNIGEGLDGCNIVAQSPYSQFLGIPLAYFGVAFYVLVLLATILTMVRPFEFSYHVLMIVTTIGALFSVAFLFIQIVLIQALCIYCIASAIIAFLSLAVAYRLFSRFAPKFPVVIP
jgi:uncharacterized membrane protein